MHEVLYVQNNYTETWRFRIGKYRVFYCVDEKDRVVYILTMDDRKDAYK